MKYSVFIVEDSDTKFKELKASLPSEYQYEVHMTKSIAQAYRPLENRPWDLIILDMTFQVSLGAGNEIAKEALAGVEVLQYMSRKRISAPVIVATQHDSFYSADITDIDSIFKLDQWLSEMFPRNYVAIVKVDLSTENWKIEFRDLVKKVLELSDGAI